MGTEETKDNAVTTTEEEKTVKEETASSEAVETVKEENAAPEKEPVAPEKTESAKEEPKDGTEENVGAGIELLNEGEKSEEKKKRRKYAVMLAKEHEDGRITTHHIGPALVEFISIVIGIIFLIFICLLIYDSIVIKNLKTDLIKEIAANNELTDRNESLSVENDTLSSKVAVLSETVSKKAATETAITTEETENAIPKGFPLSGGTSTMESAMDGDNPMIKFSASTGINIVSSGTGTVIAVEDDIDYGNRIIIDHGNGYRSIYRNAGKVLVKTGESIGKGYILFAIDDSNTAIGYQIMLNDEYIDPMDVIEING
ncbi:MAG: M23 family metallopeptidase [Lachnospiraceae bacterium]|nr:M23 family metallopeptidase [Lachnospiraceae bacterium]